MKCFKNQNEDLSVRDKVCTLQLHPELRVVAVVESSHRKFFLRTNYTVSVKSHRVL